MDLLAPIEANPTASKPCFRGGVRAAPKSNVHLSWDAAQGTGRSVSTSSESAGNRRSRRFRVSIAQVSQFVRLDRHSFRLTLVLSAADQSLVRPSFSRNF